MSSLYLDIYSKKLLVFGAVNYFILALFNFNFIDYIGIKIHNKISFIIYIIIGLAGLFQITRRDFYLGFLDKTVYPCGNLVEKKPENPTIKKTIKTAPNINVIYWSQNMMMKYSKILM